MASTGTTSSIGKHKTQHVLQKTHHVAQKTNNLNKNPARGISPRAGFLVYAKVICLFGCWGE